MRTRVTDPSTEQILAYCKQSPIERVFLEDVARRGQGRFAGVQDDEGNLRALCHLGTNVVPSGTGCSAFVDEAGRAAPRMLIGEQGAVTELWEAGETGLRAARRSDLDLLVPACASAHFEELSVDPLRRDPNGFRWRTRAQIEEARSWAWIEDGVIRFKVEASAWTPYAVQLQQVWVDPPARGRGYATRALRDLIRLLLAQVPAVCLFVRAENTPAIRLYETVGMEHVLDYRSVLF